jgi:TRAP-type C4-dicarboxylate transport system permease small subunit
MLIRLMNSLHRFAEAVAACLLAIIFVAFLVQIVMRYAFNAPVGWTTELWGAAFVLKDEEEIRIDLFTARASYRTRRLIGSVVALAIIVLFGMSLPGAWSYVTFMKVEKSSYLGVRMDITYSIYIVFVVAVILRAVRQLINGPSKTVSDMPSSASAL